MGVKTKPARPLSGTRRSNHAPQVNYGPATARRETPVKMPEKRAKHEFGHDDAALGKGFKNRGNKGYGR